MVTALFMCAATPLELAEESRLLVPVSLRVAEFFAVLAHAVVARFAGGSEGKLTSDRRVMVGRVDKSTRESLSYALSAMMSIAVRN